MTLRELTFRGEFCGRVVRDDARESTLVDAVWRVRHTSLSLLPPLPLISPPSPSLLPSLSSPSTLSSHSSHSSQLPTSFTANSTVTVNTPPTCHSIHVSLWLRQPSTLIRKLPIPSLASPTFIKDSSFAHSRSCDSHSLPLFRDVSF